VKKDMAQNILYISHGYDPIAQYGSEVKLGDFKFINEKADRNYNTPQKVKFKIRHSPEFLGGLMQLRGAHMMIASDEKIAGIAPGQFGVVYDEQEAICLGAGVIDNEF
jgi:tRNA U34 2-thiouridine synthase MnmA/TrmU